MPRIKNERYRAFIDTGLIKIIDKDEFKVLLDKARPPDIEQKRALLIATYWFGRRAIELSRLKRGSISLSGKMLVIVWDKAAKRGKQPITQFYPLKNPNIAEFWNYAKGLHPSFNVFYKFRTNAKRMVWKLDKDKKRVSYKLGTCEGSLISKYVKKVTGIPHHFFRHNRFSIMAQTGATDRELQEVKGGGSIEQYVHQSVENARKRAKFFK